MNNFEIINYLRKSVITGLGKSIIVTAVTFLFIPLIIKRIGIDDYGIIMLTLAFGSVSSFVDLGISKSVTLLIGKSEDQLYRDKIVSGALFINIILAIIIGVVVYLLIHNNVKVFGVKFDKQIYTHTILLVGFAVLVISLLRGLATAVLEAYLLMHYINFGNMLSSVLLYITIYVVTIFSTDLNILLVLPALSLLLTLVYYIVIIYLNTELNLANIEIITLKEITKFSFKFFNLGIINSIIFPANKYILVFITGNSSYLGIFDIGLKIATSANNLLNSLSAPLFGVFSNMRNFKQIFLIVKYTTFILFLAAIFGGSIFYFIKDFIAVFLDKNNSALISEISMVLLIGILFSGIAEPTYRALIGSERFREAFYLKLLYPLSNIVLFFLLFQLGGLSRICYALSTSFIIASSTVIGYFIVVYRNS